MGVRLEQPRALSVRDAQCSAVINTGPGWFNTKLSSLMASIKELTLLAGWKGRFLFSV